MGEPGAKGYVLNSPPTAVLSVWPPAWGIISIGVELLGSGA